MNCIFFLNYDLLNRKTDSSSQANPVCSQANPVCGRAQTVIAHVVGYILGLIFTGYL